MRWGVGGSCTGEARGRADLTAVYNIQTRLICDGIDYVLQRGVRSFQGRSCENRGVFVALGYLSPALLSLLREKRYAAKLSNSNKTDPPGHSYVIRKKQVQNRLLVGLRRFPRCHKVTPPPLTFHSLFVFRRQRSRLPQTSQIKRKTKLRRTKNKNNYNELAVDLNW